MEDMTGPVLVAYRAALMRRILCLNLDVENVRAVEADSAANCLRQLERHRFLALVLDPELLVDQTDEDRVCKRVQALRLPVLVVSDGREHRRLAQRLGGAPFCNRPDDLESLTAAVRGLLAGTPLP